MTARLQSISSENKFIKYLIINSLMITIITTSLFVGSFFLKDLIALAPNIKMGCYVGIEVFCLALNIPNIVSRLKKIKEKKIKEMEEIKEHLDNQVLKEKFNAINENLRKFYSDKTEECLKKAVKLDMQRDGTIKTYFINCTKEDIPIKLKHLIFQQNFFCIIMSIINDFISNYRYCLSINLIKRNIEKKDNKYLVDYQIKITQKMEDNQKCKYLSNLGFFIKFKTYLEKEFPVIEGFSFEPKISSDFS